MKSLKTTPTKLLNLERLAASNCFSSVYSSVIMTKKYSDILNSQIKIAYYNRSNLLYLMNIVVYKHFWFYALDS